MRDIVGQKVKNCATLHVPCSILSFTCIHRMWPVPRSLYPLFSSKKGYINFVPKSVIRPSVRALVSACVSICA